MSRAVQCFASCSPDPLPPRFMIMRIIPTSRIAA